jgi:hypothetical protein
MAVFTDAELEFLASQRLARLATASKAGQPDVSAVGSGPSVGGYTGAALVTWTGRSALGGPLGQEAEHLHEFPAAGRQGVAGMRRGGGHDRASDEPLLLQLFQPLGQ